MTIEFEPIDPREMDDVFNMMKAGLHDFVREVYGWDEDYQRQRMNNCYQPQWFYWIVFEGINIGFICFKKIDQQLHIHFLVVAPQFQGRGLGKKTMQRVHKIADTESRLVTLSCFKSNTQAITFYQSLGYLAASEDAYFFNFQRTVQSQ